MEKETCHVRLYDHEGLVASFSPGLDSETVGIEMMKLFQRLKE